MTAASAMRMLSTVLAGRSVIPTHTPVAPNMTAEPPSIA